MTSREASLIFAADTTSASIDPRIRTSPGSEDPMDIGHAPWITSKRRWRIMFNVLVRCVLHVIFILCSHSILAQGLSFECSIWFLPTLPHLYTPLPQGGICDLIASAIRLRLISSNQLSALHSLLGKSKHGKGGPELSYYLYLRLLLVPKLLFSLYTRNPPFPSDPRFDISGFLS